MRFERRDALQQVGAGSVGEIAAAGAEPCVRGQLRERQRRRWRRCNGGRRRRLDRQRRRCGGRWSRGIDLRGGERSASGIRSISRRRRRFGQRCGDRTLGREIDRHVAERVRLRREWRRRTCVGGGKLRREQRVAVGELFIAAAAEEPEQEEDDDGKPEEDAGDIVLVDATLAHGRGSSAGAVVVAAIATAAATTCALWRVGDQRRRLGLRRRCRFGRCWRRGVDGVGRCRRSGCAPAGHQDEGGRLRGAAQAAVGLDLLVTAEHQFVGCRLGLGLTGDDAQWFALRRGGRRQGGGADGRFGRSS